MAPARPVAGQVARLLAEAPERHMVIRLLRDDDGRRVVGYEVVAISSWHRAISRCAQLQDMPGNRIVDFQVRSTRDPKWQHLLRVGSTRNTFGDGRPKARWEAAAKLLRVAVAAGQLDGGGRGGWQYRDGRPVAQGAESCFGQLPAVELVRGDAFTYVLAGIRGGVAAV